MQTEDTGTTYVVLPGRTPEPELCVIPLCCGRRFTSPSPVSPPADRDRDCKLSQLAVGPSALCQIERATPEGGRERNGMGWEQPDQSPEERGPIPQKLAFARASERASERGEGAKWRVTKVVKS